MKKWILLFFFSLHTFFLTAQEGTIVCIHGFMTTARSMKPIERTLKRTGFKTYSWEFPSRQRTIQEHACYLVQFLQEIACNCPEEPINFVTHSTGALILRAALNFPDCPEAAKCGKAVLLAPPNQGSKLARQFRNFTPLKYIVGPKMGWELMNYDLCAIQQFGYFPKTMEMYIVAGTKGNTLFFCEPNDGFIALQETRLDTPYYWTSYPIDHGNLLTSSKILRLIRCFFYWGACERSDCCD